jgi:FSR family fosmidomycin resistance protein-like MFS transporter
MASGTGTVAASPAGVRTRELDRRGMAVVSCGHALTDTCQGAVPALLPFLIAAHGWSYAAASALVLAGTVSSSVIQPLFGLAADKRSMSWLMPAGVLLAGVGVGLAAVVGNYALTFAAVTLSGLGVAAFHPEGSRFANYLSGSKRASGMSLFSVGGNAGFAMGPALTTPLVALFGLEGALLLIVPVGAVALLIATELPRLQTFRPALGGAGSPGSAAADGDRGEENWSAFCRLGVVITARTFAFFGLVTFVPLYFIDELGTSKAEGNLALFVMLAGGATGTLLGGPLADRIGRRPVIIAGMAALPLLVLVFLGLPPLTGTLLLFFIGMAVVASFSVTVVLGQEYLPNRIGLASGITLGLAIGLGGLGAPVLGLVADADGLTTTMYVIALLPLLGLAFALTLPRERGVPGFSRGAARARARR